MSFISRPSFLAPLYGWAARVLQDFVVRPPVRYQILRYSRQ